MPNMSLPNVGTKNDYKGKPVSVLLSRMGNPDYQQTISGQKFYMWRIGVSDRTCLVAAGLSGDVDSGGGLSERRADGEHDGCVEGGRDVD